MLVCVSCNIEFKEDKKFCSYCGGPLTAKEDLAQDKKDPERGKEKSEQKLICPNCKMIYEFGSSCIQCGSHLVTEITEIPTDAEKVQPLGPREKPIGKSRENLICPTCKTIYENGNFCAKCGSPLIPQTLTQALEEAKATFNHQTGEEPIHLRTIQKQSKELPRKNLICPECKIIYERGSSCVRCGSALVAEVTAQEVEVPEPPGGPTQTLDSSSPNTLTDSVQASEPKVLSPSSRGLGLAAGPPEESNVAKEIKHIDKTLRQKEHESFLDKEIDKNPEASKQDSETRSQDNLERRTRYPKKSKIDYRRLFFEVGSISIMVLAGGYFLWSVYSHITKSPEPKTPRPATSKLPNPLSATAKTSVPHEPGNEEPEQRSATSKEGDTSRPSPFNSISSDASTLEGLETARIKDLLESIRQANLRKDIDLFVSCYATGFKDREGKKKATLSFWKKFDYLELSYDLKSISITRDAASIRIEWVMKIASKAGGNPEESRTFSDAVLKKEEEGWKIQEVKPVG